MWLKKSAKNWKQTCKCSPRTNLKIYRKAGSRRTSSLYCPLYNFVTFTNCSHYSTSKGLCSRVSGNVGSYMHPPPSLLTLTICSSCTPYSRQLQFTRSFQHLRCIRLTSMASQSSNLRHCAYSVFLAFDTSLCLLLCFSFLPKVCLKCSVVQQPSFFSSSRSHHVVVYAVSMLINFFLLHFVHV